MYIIKKIKYMTKVVLNDRLIYFNEKNIEKLLNTSACSHGGID